MSTFASLNQVTSLFKPKKSQKRDIFHIYKTNGKTNTYLICYIYTNKEKS